MELRYFNPYIYGLTCNCSRRVRKCVIMNLLLYHQILMSVHGTTPAIIHVQIRREVIHAVVDRVTRSTAARTVQVSISMSIII